MFFGSPSPNTYSTSVVVNLNPIPNGTAVVSFVERTRLTISWEGVIIFGIFLYSREMHIAVIPSPSARELQGSMMCRCRRNLKAGAMQLLTGLVAHEAVAPQH